MPVYRQTLGRRQGRELVKRPLSANVSDMAALASQGFIDICAFASFGLIMCP
jgi:hypothetical protein